MPLKLVPTPLGNLDDISYRCLRALEESQTVLCEDTRVAKKLLTLLSKRFNLNFENKNFISLHSHNEEKILPSLESELRQNACVYTSDAGMPGISDPGAKLVKFCQEKLISYEVLPGPNAAITAYASSGFLDGKFLFYGFLQHKSEARKAQLRELLDIGYGIVLYEAPHRLLQLLEELKLLCPARDLFAAKELSKLHERYYFGSAESILKQLKDKTILGEWTVVIDAHYGEKNSVSLCADEIISLPLPKKEQARLLAKIGPKSAKEYYEELIAAAK